MSVLVVTGTSTGVGKTVVTAAVATLAAARGARVAVVKPAQTGVLPGELGDVEEVGRLTGISDLHEFYRLPDPLAPAAAARLRGLPAPDLAAAARRIQELTTDRDLVVVEGAGGLLVRFDDDGATLADLAHDLDAELLLVAHPTLGTLNHTALTLEVMAHRGLRLAGIVLGWWPPEPDLACRCNLDDLQMLGARPLAGAMQADAGRLSAAQFLPRARAGLAPWLGGTFDAADFTRRNRPNPEEDAL
jgi:dethiobiotin synthetase